MPTRHAPERLLGAAHARRRPHGGCAARLDPPQVAAPLEHARSDHSV